MICPSCRAENIEGADECVNCGHSLAGLDLPDTPDRVKRYRQAPDFVHESISVLPKEAANTVGAADPVGLAIRIMQRQNTNCILVVDGSKTVGIISGTDILQRVAGKGIDLNAVTCAQLMTPDPMTLSDDDSVAVAINVMASSNFRHLPILRDGMPTALIDVNDLFRYISPHLV